MFAPYGGACLYEGGAQAPRGRSTPPGYAIGTVFSKVYIYKFIREM